MTAEVYKVIHITGVATMLFALGGLCFHALGGGAKKHDGRRGMMMTHGIGLLLSLVGGFGLLVRKGFSMGDGWVILKISIWLAFGLMTMMLYRNQRLNKMFLILTILLVITAVLLVQYKPRIW